MHIRHYFHNEEDLARRLGRGFVRRWKQLLERYSKRIHLPIVTLMKMTSLSFAFYLAAQEGNAEVVYHFDDLLHGWSTEQMWLDNMPLQLQDDNCIELVWDMAALMLEEDPTLPQMAQYAYDVVGGHVNFAYELTAEPVQELPAEKAEVKIDDKISLTLPVQRPVVQPTDNGFDFEKIVTYAESLDVEELDDAKVIQHMLFDLAGPNCGKYMHERIKNITHHVAQKRCLNADNLYLINHKGPISAGRADIDVKGNYIQNQYIKEQES